MTEDDVRRIVREELAAKAKSVHVQLQGEASWTFHQWCECSQCKHALGQIAAAQEWARQSGTTL